MVVVFSTPPEEVSFSGLVDQALRITGRVNALEQAVGYGNQVFREAQSLGLFADDNVEKELISEGNPHIYSAGPRVRSLITAKYMTQDIWPDFIAPGKKQRNKDYYFYKTESSYVFRGALTGEVIAVFENSFLPSLPYYRRLADTNTIVAQYSIRPAYYDPFEDVWYYLNSAGDGYVTALGDTNAEELARTKSANWLVTKWDALVLEGIKGKLWNAVGDDRGRASFSLYKSLLGDLQKTVYPAEGN